MTKYRITKVESKRDTMNRWHGKVLRKTCTIDRLELDMTAWFTIDGLRYPGDSILYSTSTVTGIEESGSTLIIETMNSVYTLEKLDE